MITSARFIPSLRAICTIIFVLLSLHHYYGCKVRANLLLFLFSPTHFAAQITGIELAHAL